MNDLTDNQLVAAAKKGDKQAYAELVKKYSRKVFALCYGIMANPSDAEDVAQEALIKGFMRIGQINENSSFKSWLMTVARNSCLDALRKRKETVELDNISSLGQGHKEFERTDLRLALQKLPEHYRVPLMLYYFNGQSTENLAKNLNISVAGAFTRLSRARKELRDLMVQGGRNQ